MKPNDLVQSTLSFLILRILATEPMAEWALAQRLKQMWNDALHAGPGSLYPALHKLEQDGWISAEWLVSESRRRVKSYCLSKADRKQLQAQSTGCQWLSGAISAIVLSVKG
jgi:DNA-binding PadR family transcriptional regulator